MLNDPLFKSVWHAYDAVYRLSDELHCPERGRMTNVQDSHLVG